MVSKYAPNRGYALNKGCDERHTLQAGMRDCDSQALYAQEDMWGSMRRMGEILLDLVVQS